ncbi:LysR substrate-binding domain-containing protein [Thauera butanivorans]|uniref:LysR substrate-binding domain-containing protein n=1 Tax=Thauera butanivorans TaxID=86174 RepID=UPI000837E488|nr:LysR substrate-binding domain-containing protein [Thauera butanivorans]
MNLHLLKVFVHVAEENSFSRAAEKLGISQPAASKSVRELESQLDVVLLERRGRFFEPTEAGQVLLEYGRSLFALEREADEALRAFNGLGRGRLRIGASTTIATYWLPSFLRRFHECHPGVRLQVVAANTRQIAARLLDCQVDVALVEGRIDDARVEVRLWRSEEMIVISPRGAPLAAVGDEAGLCGLQATWIMRERGSGSRDATEALLRRMGVEAGEIIEVGSNEAIVQAVAAGIGFGVVPRICARDALALGRVRRHVPVSGPIERLLYRLRLPHRPVSPAALAFEALLATPESAEG